MVYTESIYWYGVAAAVYLTSCYMFAAVRWFHTCREPKEKHDYFWPERKLLVVFYMMATVLLPYLFNPTSPTAWTLWKAYFPGTYYFYGGALFFCFFGTVRRWERWKATIRATAAITFVAMAPLVADAWLPGRVLSQDFRGLWLCVVAAVGVGMMIYCPLPCGRRCDGCRRLATRISPIPTTSPSTSPVASGCYPS